MVKLRSDTSEPPVVPRAPVTDSRVSSADVGVYMRCRWPTGICAPYGDLDWLIAESGMSDAETRTSVRRLAEIRYLDTVGPVMCE
ncbi:hypothetical protein ACFU99_28575 [Streptomyces sp. NPDC057654]|uniref:hypothetical protein n=1 Tax=Streptomyces sp. NPDC057654 TaxID=3346196 RepID=UPI00369F5BDF